MPINKLTDVQVRRAKPRERPFRLTDSGGLHLYVTETGSKLWRMRYEYAGKEKLLSFGAYPKVALEETRRYRATAKEALDQGRDPSVVKKQRRFAFVADSAKTFEAIAREWYDLQKPTWVPRHADGMQNGSAAALRGEGPRQARGPCQHQHRRLARQVPRAEPDREHLAVHARQLALQPRLHLLRQHRRPLLRGMEQAGRSALAHHDDRTQTMGSSVLINAGWYKLEIPSRCSLVAPVGVSNMRIRLRTQLADSAFR